MGLHLLPVTGPTVFAFRAVDESRVFGVKTMKPVGLFVYKGVVLGDKLPADFRRDDVGMNGRRGGIVRIRVDGGTGCGRCHDEDEKDVGRLLASAIKVEEERCGRKKRRTCSRKAECLLQQGRGYRSRVGDCEVTTDYFGWSTMTAHNVEGNEERCFEHSGQR